MHKNPTETAVHKIGLSVPLYTRKHPLKFANIKFNSSQQVIQMYNQFQSVWSNISVLLNSSQFHADYFSSSSTTCSMNVVYMHVLLYTCSWVRFWQINWPLATVMRLCLVVTQHFAKWHRLSYGILHTVLALWSFISRYWEQDDDNINSCRHLFPELVCLLQSLFMFVLCCLVTRL